MAIGNINNIGVNAFNPQNQDVQGANGVGAEQNIPNIGGVGGAGGPLPEVAGFAEVQRHGAQNMPRVEVNALRGHVQPQAPEGHNAKVARWFREGTIRLRGNGGLPPTVRIENPRLGTVRYSAKELKSLINTLPRLERQAARENLVEHLSARINNGIRAFENAMGDNPERPTMQDAADLMLFLDAKAHTTGNGFTQGAFSIEDQNNKLYTYLDSCPEKYLRSSSHLKDSQCTQVQGHTNVHRGIDTPKGLNGLPNGKATILFASIPARGDVSSRIFLKPETAGCRLSMLKPAHLEAGSSVFPQRPARFADLGRTLKHGCSFLASPKGRTNNALGSDGVRKERISSGIKDAYKKVIKTVQQFTPNNGNIEFVKNARDSIVSTLKDYNLSSTSDGLHDMLARLKDVKYKVNNDDLHLIDLSDTLEQAVEVFTQTVANKIKDASCLDSRICNEVMFSTADLQEQNHADEAHAMNGAERAAALLMATQATDVDKARYAYAKAVGSVEALFARHHVEGDVKANCLAILERNPAGGDIHAEQMIDNIKDVINTVSDALPHGLARNEISIHCSRHIKRLSQFDSRRAPDATNRQVFRDHMMGMVQHNRWNPAQVAVCAAARPEHAMILQHHAESVKASFDTLLATNLPQVGTPEYERDTSAVNNALAKCFQAVEVAYQGTIDGADALVEIGTAVCNFALAGLNMEQKQDLYAKFCNPDCQKKMAYMVGINLALETGPLGRVGIAAVVGPKAKRNFVIESMVDGLERSLNVPVNQRLPSDNYAVVKQHMATALNAQTRAIFQGAQTVQNPDGSQHIQIAHGEDAETVSLAIVDGKRAVPFAEALEKAQHILPQIYQLDNARDVHLTIQKPEGRVVVSTPEDVFKAFTFNAEDGTEYVDLDLCRAVTSLACQTTLAESESFIQGGGFPDSIKILGQVQGGQSSRSFVFNPADNTLTIRSSESRPMMLNGNDVIDLDDDSQSSISMKMTLNQANDGHYDVNLARYNVSVDWGLKDESPYR